jgi:hypothetical protein
VQFWNWQHAVKQAKMEPNRHIYALKQPGLEIKPALFGQFQQREGESEESMLNMYNAFE